MIRLRGGIRIPEDEITMTAVTSQGPGGQNVNRVATAVQLRFDAARSSLPEKVKERVLSLKDRRKTKSGVIVIRAQRYRSRERNREDALERLRTLLEKAMAVPARRRKTKPGKAARERRLQEKKRRSDVKKLRRPVA
jgi:ribosome-associated protein